MLDPNKVKIGIAPIAWTEDDMPEMGAENSFLQTISEIAPAGIFPPLRPGSAPISMNSLCGRTREPSLTT